MVLGWLVPMDIHLPSWDTSSNSIWALVKSPLHLSTSLMFPLEKIWVGPISIWSTTIGVYCFSIPTVVFKCFLALGFIINQINRTHNHWWLKIPKLWLIKWICYQIIPLNILNITPWFINHLTLYFRWSEWTIANSICIHMTQLTSKSMFILIQPVDYLDVLL